MMSRERYLNIVRLLLVLALVFAINPANAQGKPDSGGEIVYRASLGRADDVKLLLEEGISPNHKNPKGVPILCLAAARVDDEGLNVVKALHDSGADINRRDNEGRNALFYAAKKGNKESIKYLLENKINYYAVDFNGDIARTIAYRNGHSDVVTVLDDFVRAETEKVAEQYRKLSKALEESYKDQAESQRKIAEDAANKALERSRIALENAERIRKEQIETAKTPAPEAVKSYDLEVFAQIRHDLTFHSCSFQYWSFCEAAKQTSELTPESMKRAVATHLEQIETVRNTMRKEFNVPIKQTKKIIDSAQRSIFNELNNMPSKTYRFENGVCRMDDLVARCNEIAKYPGQVTTDAKKAPRKKRRGRSTRHRGKFIPYR